jgi:hypothetical protein
MKDTGVHPQCKNLLIQFPAHLFPYSPNRNKRERSVMNNRIQRVPSDVFFLKGINLPLNWNANYIIVRSKREVD